MKVTKTNTTVVTETVTYHIHPNVCLKEITNNGKQTCRELQYCGKNLKSKFGDIRYFNVLYSPDLKYLESTNPWWSHNREEDSAWFEGKNLPAKPEDIDVSKIILASGYDHAFWTIDLTPIPVVVMGEYIDAGIRSNNYDLEKLHKYLSQHHQVKELTKIERIPYYNNDGGSEQYFSVKVLPTIDQLKKMDRRVDIFYKPWKQEDYLGMKQFWIGKDS